MRKTELTLKVNSLRKWYAGTGEGVVEQPKAGEWLGAIAESRMTKRTRRSAAAADGRLDFLVALNAGVRLCGSAP